MKTVREHTKALRDAQEATKKAEQEAQWAKAQEKVMLTNLHEARRILGDLVTAASNVWDVLGTLAVQIDQLHREEGRITNKLALESIQRRVEAVRNPLAMEIQRAQGKR